MDRPQKVIAYIVKNDRILVIRHADFSIEQTGLQVPAGTIKSGELPEHAVLRESYEETGLKNLRIVRYLGAGEYDMRPYADAIHARHYFHLTADDAELPEKWEWQETHDGIRDPTRFELYWIDLRQSHVLASGQAAFIGRISGGNREIKDDHFGHLTEQG